MSDLPAKTETLPAMQPPAAVERGVVRLVLLRLGLAGAWIEAHPLTMRWLLSGPLALIAAIVTMTAMPFWLPTGASGFDHVAIPVLIFPVIWTATVIYPCLEDRLVRATLVMSLATLGQAALIASAL